jgi:hypothetical protein
LAASVNTAPIITSCGAGGRSGPTLQMCQRAYRNSSFPAGFLRGVTNGIQNLFIRRAGLYKVSAAGAQGGGGTYRPGFDGAPGAVASALFEFAENTSLFAVVGQPGNTWSTNFFSTTTYGGAGGGGTFLWQGATPNQPLLVAGGGGGVSYTTSGGNGEPGRAVSSGGLATGTGNRGVGGTNGGGGSEPSNGGGNNGAGGGGWRSDGNCPFHSSSCGKGVPGNFIGGLARTGGTYSGGFGGGGAGNYEGGGGGGYSGGRAHVLQPLPQPHSASHIFPR